MADYTIDLTSETTELVSVEPGSSSVINLEVDVETLSDFEISVVTPPAQIAIDLAAVDYTIDLQYQFSDGGEVDHSHAPVSKVLNYTNGQLSSVVSSTRTLTLAYNISGTLETVTSADWTKTLTYNPDGSLAAVTVS